MKTIKKVFAMLLAVVMVMGLSAPAFAAGTEKGSIMIKNAVADLTYTAYKIFDVTYTDTDEDGEYDAYSNTIANDSKWLEAIGDYIVTDNGTDNPGNFMESVEKQGTATGNGMTLTLSADGSVYVVTVTEDFSAADFAAYLYDNIPEDVTGTPLTYDSENETAYAKDLELGYYFVTSSLGSLANLTTTNPDAVIYDKNVMDFDKKQTDEEDGEFTDDPLSVEVGGTVYYQITGKIMSTTGYTTYTYIVSDTLSEGLTFNNDVMVVVDGKGYAGFGSETLTEIEDGAFGRTDKYSEPFLIEYTENGYVLYVDMEQLQDYVGNTIYICYTATVNENAVTVVSENKATLEYSNDPNDETSTDKVKDEVEVYTSKIVIDKYAKDNTEAKLSGASFVLYKTVTVDGEEKTLYYKYTEADSSANTPASVNWVEHKDSATVVTTDENGAAEFVGLEDGTYYLLEIEAPAGYNLLTGPVEVVVDAENHAGEITGSPSNYKERWDNESFNTMVLTYKTGVANSTGAELPSTGGMGATIFYVVGSILVLGAAVLLIVKKRMSGAEE